MAILVSNQTNEQAIRDKYAQDLVRLANYIKIGSTRSQLLHVTNVSHLALNSLYKSVIEMMFAEIEIVKEGD